MAVRDEQDWMNFQHERMPLLTQSATAGRAWLREMGAAALDAGVSVQYCMSYVRHVLQSIEIDAVTQVRGGAGGRMRMRPPLEGTRRLPCMLARDTISKGAWVCVCGGVLFHGIRGRNPAY